MPTMATSIPQGVGGGSCRLCRAYCDWTVDPTACVDTACPNLYAYDDERGRRIVGCVERVFTAEIDLDVFQRVRERTAAGSACSRRPPAAPDLPGVGGARLRRPAATGRLREPGVRRARRRRAVPVHRRV